MFQPSNLSPGIGFALMLGLGAVMFVVAFAVRSMVKNTHDFVIADRRIGFGFGVGSVIAVWTWSMAVMMSSAQAFTFGTSGLIWFVVPNGLAVMVMVPFALRLRRQMPAGYTIVEFIRARFQNKPATTVMLVAMLLGLLAEIFINLFGVVLVMGVVFELNPTVVLIVTLATVTVYSYFGGLWTSAITATFNTLLITVPAALVVLYVLHKVGGPELVFQKVDAAGPNTLNAFDSSAAAAFGISLALGLLASTMADQTFWQKAWALKPASMGRTFVWAGMWFYPIPIVLGLLGLVGLAFDVNPADLGDAGPGGIGPYVVSHLGLPIVLVALYVLIILNACYSSIDGAFSALSSVVAVDVLKRAKPDIAPKSLFRYTKASILVAGVIGGVVVSSGIDYVQLVNTVFFLKAALIIPLGLAIFWKRMTSTAFVASLVLAIAIGYPVRETVGELQGIITLEAISLVAAVGISLLSKQSFDFATLRNRGDALTGDRGAAEPVVAADPDPVR
ncbi:sodium:solute symporter family protein [Mycolicibacterium litorale]|uniref:Solute:Na+ symporter, SSS family protein n=1 Tax=Mycolicibacterium litorale TaxID=758802 RepID=A0AAD1MUI1_9MYCO|nr:sodium:solute symporter [Mycolicibacterium litorale]MCV7416455.1 sodium:solute symporter [Mycolicibacterium litorale]TDY09709.1 Na+/proline symporter [Mycolicibacterium litorale]BBY17655.1 solute:Na+ symporter, SSS family protein [Mycolicibacterium litorale]